MRASLVVLAVAFALLAIAFFAPFGIGAGTVAILAGAGVTLLMFAIYYFGYLDGRDEVLGLDGESYPVSR